MKHSSWVRLLASVVVVLGFSGRAGAEPVEDALKAIQKQIDDLNKKGQYTVNTGSLAIESWLLSATAVESTAGKIRTSVNPFLASKGPNGTDKKVLVVAGTEGLDFAQSAMISAEIQALTARLMAVRGESVRPGIAPAVSALPAIAGAVIGMLKSETELTAQDVTIDAKLTAAKVARGLGNAVLPTAKIAPSSDSDLIKSFNLLVVTAEETQRVHDILADEKNPTPSQKEKVVRMKAALARYDTFYAKVTTASASGVVPLSAAARLDELMQGDPYVLRILTEKSGGTLLKRTNVLTALGANSAFISGGLVSSYHLTDPRTGQVFAEGVITCRTTLTSLKQVQSASWTTVDVEGVKRPAQAVCSP